MQHSIKFVLIVSSFLCLFSCNDTPVPMDLAAESIIPQPLSLTATGSSFEINAKTSIYSDGDLKTANYLAELLKPATGFDIDIKPMSSKPSKNHIFLDLEEGGEFGDEGYKIDIAEDGIVLSAKAEHGLFNGVQTLRQLLPAEIEKKSIQTGPWLVATGTIFDKPEYEYRGSMLDVSRHFIQKEDVKRLIDQVSQYKINKLHLHLSDDQGWRIEIKSWPNLTLHGGSTQVGGGKGGFYTQEEYKDIVNYAANRFITIIPEIDMPGHTTAALSSYPELNCDGKAPELYTGIDVGFSTLCTDKEVVYEFIDDVIRELAAMTPGPYIHIGGDESLVTEMKDYIPFIERTAKIVKKYNKKVIGWDEIAHASLPSNSIVQYWDVAKNAKMGVDQNAKVLISPATKTYLDMQYDSTTSLGLHWAAYIEIDSAYIWDPAQLIEGVNKENILGVESPLWSETILNMDNIEYMVFPRLICHSEIGWTPQNLRKWDNFKVKLGRHKDKLEFQGVDFYPSKLVPWQTNASTQPNI